MKALLCDKCKRILSENEKVIVAHIMYELNIDTIKRMEELNIPIVECKHFCSVECLKESIK